MSAGPNLMDEMPVIRDRKDFDTSSGNWLERAFFNHRRLVIGLCTLVTLVLAVPASRIEVSASFDDMIPQQHPYIQNYFAHKEDLAGLGNSIRVVVENTQGDIYDPEYMDVLRQVNDAVFLMPGVDRAWMKSLWMSSVRWNEVTEEGFRGGPVIPGNYDGSAASVGELRANVRRSGIVGNLVASNQRSSMLVVPLHDVIAETHQPLDYRALSKDLEALREKYRSHPKVKIHIIGFAKLMGDLLDGLWKVIAYFGVAAAVATLVIFLYTRCIRSTLVVLVKSLVAVVWLVGVVQLLGYKLDPFSILVPFLTFAMGVSHGAQKMNGILQDVGRGTDKYVAARYTFRRLFMAGLTALLADGIGFAVLLLIDIPVIHSLAVQASVGVLALIFTNLVLLPITLSFVGVSRRAAERCLAEERAMAAGQKSGLLWRTLQRFTLRRYAVGAIAVSAALAVAGFVMSLGLKIGDVHPGAPELRPNSTYNKDVAFVTSNYALSSDQFAVIVKTPPDGGAKSAALTEIDRLGWALQQVPGVQTTISLADTVRVTTSGIQEGSLRWNTISREQAMVDTAVTYSVTNTPDMTNKDVSVVPMIAYLADHKAETLDAVLAATERFAAEHDTAEMKFLPAAGTSGIEAITNIVVREANRKMMLYVYAVVICLCFITFRSWRATVVAVIPLILTSVLCEALMAMLGIGVKVATLPVIALGVGIGVDYALYLLAVQLDNQRAGMPLTLAYARALIFTGKVVGLVGITLAAGVVTWAWSPIKFQADMGILLTFMFLWNMIGALVLIPALSHFLLRGEADRVSVASAASTATAP